MGLFNFLKRKEFEIIKNLQEQLDKYTPIINVQDELDRKNYELTEKEIEIRSLIATKELELNQIINYKNDALSNIQIKIDQLNNDYQSAHGIYSNLRKDISIFEPKLDLIEYGIYEPIYDFEKSERYRIEQKSIIDQQKFMVQVESAATCSTRWTIDGSESRGKASTNRFIKLILRAFNGECNALIGKVKWNNINLILERVRKSYDTLNKLGKSSQVNLSNEYLELKIKEIVLEYKYQVKRQNEKEEMRAIQEELREEEKAKRDFERAQREAEKEELDFQKALLKARKEVENATGELQEQLNSKIISLEQELLLVQEKKERALSMAQQTKRGHVYIISNIGSFGENVYKIGMTRRLEPSDRVRELGDASVPFKFDTHAMIYSDEARTLEYELHKAFSDKKVNMLNYRKELVDSSDKCNTLFISECVVENFLG